MNTTATILTGDCLALLPALPAGSAQLVYLDPPFNIGLDYPGYDDRRLAADYFAWLAEVFRAVLGVLSPAGMLCVQCGQTIQARVYVLLESLGLYWRNSIIWHYTFGPHQKRKFVPSWQVVHGFGAHPRRLTFNADSVRVPSARQLKYRDKRANPRGRIPGDVWTVSRVCGTFRERVKGHGCQTPLELLERIIGSCTQPGEWIVDPMAGTGSAGVAALGLGRRFVGVELCAETAEKARQRLAAAPQDAAGS